VIIATLVAIIGLKLIVCDYPPITG